MSEGVYRNNAENIMQWGPHKDANAHIFHNSDKSIMV